MRRSTFILSAILAALPALAASVQSAKPEQAGFSSERLVRIHEMVQRHIDAHDISGAVTLVARNGKIVHFEAHGLADVEANAKLLRDHQAAVEFQLLAVPATSWPEAVAKARYVLNLYAADLAQADTHHRDLSGTYRSHSAWRKLSDINVRPND